MFDALANQLAFGLLVIPLFLNATGVIPVAEAMLTTKVEENAIH
jgi:hypothetical protein